MDHRLPDPLLTTAEAVPALAAPRHAVQSPGGQLIGLRRRPARALMTRLAALLARLATLTLQPLLRALTFQLAALLARQRRIGGRRDRAVPRVAALPPLKLLDPLQQLDQQLARRLPARHRDRFCLRSVHDRKIPCTRQETCSRPRRDLNAYTVATLYPTRTREHLDPLAAHGVPVHVLSGADRRTRARGGMRRLPCLIHASRPDVVYAWLEEAATVVVAMARCLRLPIVVSRRNVCGSAMVRHALARIAIRRIEAAATLVTANSEGVREEAVSRGIARVSICVVPNGHEELVPLKEPAAPPVRLGYVAHLRPEMGHLRLLQALEQLGRAWTGTPTLAGAGPLEGAGRTQIAQRRLG